MCDIMNQAFVCWWWCLNCFFSPLIVLYTHAEKSGNAMTPFLIIRPTWWWLCGQNEHIKSRNSAHDHLQSLHKKPVWWEGPVFSSQSNWSECVFSQVRLNVSLILSEYQMLKWYHADNILFVCKTCLCFSGHGLGCHFGIRSCVVVFLHPYCWFCA